MNRSSLLVLLALVAPLAACTQTDLLADEGSPAPGFGETQRHNLAAQAVNPAAPDDKNPISMDGTRAELAQTRYQQGKVVQPSDVEIGAVGSTGGSSAGQ